MIAQRSIERGDYKVFWQKAADFRSAMESAEQEHNWNSLGLTSVHCAISANDALLAFYAGRRASGTDHREAVNMLRKDLKIKDASKQAERLLRIIAKKSLIEYEAKPFHEKDAREVYQQTIRFYEWAQNSLNID